MMKAMLLEGESYAFEVQNLCFCRSTTRMLKILAKGAYGGVICIRLRVVKTHASLPFSLFSFSISISISSARV